MTQDQQTYQRAANAALLGLVVQVVMGVLVALLGLYAGSPAMHVASLYIFGGLPVWIIIWLIFNQHRLERVEALEAEQLAQSDAQSAAIFEEAGDQLAMARRRLENLYKWGLKIVSGLLAVYLLLMGSTWMLVNYRATVSNPTVVSLRAGELQLEDVKPGTTHFAQLADLVHQPDARMVLLIIGLFIGGFIAFLISRYVAGMTRTSQWLLLRGGAGYLMGNVVAMVLLGLAAVGAMADYPYGLLVLNLLLPAMMILLGLEVSVGFVLDIYRPRKSGQFDRPAFDSRILGWLTRPESLGKIISETVNYQFGWEISRSWFYRLIGQAIAPMTLITLLVLYGLSSIVLVAPQQQAVVTTFGKMEQRILEPGLRFKWPWLISSVEKYDVQRVRQIVVGSDTELKEGDAHRPRVAILWTNQHTVGEEGYLVTAPSRRQLEHETDDTALAAGLVGARLSVLYRIDDLRAYVTGVQNPGQTMHLAAERELNDFFVQRDIDTLLGRGRREADDVIRAKLQADADAMNLGVKILFVGMEAIHPPQDDEVAVAFQAQIDAEQERQSMLNEAQREATSTLTMIAGSRDRAMAIEQAIRLLDQQNQQLTALERAAEDQRDEQAIEQMRREILEQELAIEQLLDDAGGEAAQILHVARAYRWDKTMRALAEVQQYRAQLGAFRTAPQYYRTRSYLEVLADGLRDRRKIILVNDTDLSPTIRIDLKTPRSALDFGAQE